MAVPVIQPRMLKDFLQDQNLPFPRSRKSSISVFLHAAVKSSSVLRRGISRRFSNKTSSMPGLPEPKMNRTTSVTVKDILRWKSFRDLADPVEIDVLPPSSEETATTTSAGTPRSSWCDSDFTVDDDDDDDSPLCFRESSGDSDVTDKKSFHINIAAGDRNTRDLKDQILLVEEDEQFSPISVLDFTHEHEKALSPFHQILEDMEMKKLPSLIQVNDDTESFIIEEQAIRLMDRVKTTSSIEEWDLSLDCLLLDYFRDELIMTSKNVKNNGRLESRVLNVAKCWVSGEDDGSLEWKMEGRKQVCIREMEGGSNWKDFEDDREDVAVEIEKMMLNHLLDELSINLLNVYKT